MEFLPCTLVDGAAWRRCVSTLRKQGRGCHDTRLPACLRGGCQTEDTLSGSDGGGGGRRGGSSSSISNSTAREEELYFELVIRCWAVDSLEESQSVLRDHT